MRVAIVHDWLVTDAGAEKVLRALIDIYPQSDIYSIVDFLSDRDRESVLAGKKSHTSFIQRLPFAKKYFRNYFFLFPLAIESFDLSRYDLIISSSWAVAKGAKKGSNATHICYCHTPIRYAWDLYDEYLSQLSPIKKIFFSITMKYIRWWDRRSSDRVDYFIANSKFVANRIKNIYNRESIVVYPPVDTDSFLLNSKKEDFYLTASRLVPYKKTKLIVKAFNKMSNKKLVVIGDGEDLEPIKAIASENIEVLGFQEKDILIDYMQRSKGFVYAAIEDFGIVSIEAMSCGTPIVALGLGGTAETVIDGFNGVHFHTQDVDAIVDAIEKFEKIEFDNTKISDYAKIYNDTRFKDELMAYIKNYAKI